MSTDSSNFQYDCIEDGMNQFMYKLSDIFIVSNAQDNVNTCVHVPDSITLEIYIS